MMTELSASNFKSWEQIPKMRLAPITGLFGSNSSGKTSILQLLLMLKQTVESPDRTQVLYFGDERSLINLGSFRDAVHLHEKPGNMRFSLAWESPKPLKVQDPTQRKTTLFEAKQMGFEASVSENGSGRLGVDHMAYGFAGRRFSMSRKGESEGKYELAAEAQDFRFVRTPGRVWDLPAPVKCYGFPDQVKAYFQNAGFLADLQLAFEELFSRVYYLGPLREYPKREYPWAGAEPADMGRRGERAVDALLAAAASGRTIASGVKGKKKRRFEEHVGRWLKRLGLVHGFCVQPIAKGGRLYEVRVRKSRRTPDVLLPDVGFGVSQVLPIVVLCFYAKEGSIILLEQPELHLHPSVQMELADLFIEAARAQKVQIIFESHSEHLLRRLQRRIAEARIRPNLASLYFCDVSDGRSRLTALDLDTFGNITNWPKDFFGDRFGEMAEMTRAAIKRKKAQQP